jgi:hypothetical protein
MPLIVGALSTSIVWLKEQVPFVAVTIAFLLAVGGANAEGVNTDVLPVVGDMLPLVADQVVLLTALVSVTVLFTHILTGAVNTGPLSTWIV